jgi:hypothetical protein
MTAHALAEEFDAGGVVFWRLAFGSSRSLLVMPHVGAEAKVHAMRPARRTLDRRHFPIPRHGFTFDGASFRFTHALQSCRT